MRRRPALVVALLALAAALAAGASGGSGAAPGLDGETILLGGTAPLSGPASAYASVSRGAQAYFAWANARGGVHGRKIEYRVVDDAYNPALSVQATKQLVEQDGVFAVFNSLGAEHNLAVRGYLNARKVPQLFVASGATAFGRDFKRYPWTIGFQPSYRAESWIYGRYLARTRPGAKVGVLFQNDDYGKDLLAGLRSGVARSKVKIVATQGYEVTAPDVQSQVAQLKASGADVLVLFATPRFAIQGFQFAARLGWRPLVIVNAVSNAANVMATASEGGANATVQGALSLAYLKDPTSPVWRDDAAIRLYRTIMARHAKGASPRDTFHLYGMAVAYQTVRLLKAAGKDPTRAAVRAQLGKLADASNPFLLPGITVRTNATERFPVEQAQLQRYGKGGWKTFGGLWGFRAG